MGHTVLFTHLKIILLQCFQFSVFSFSNNKLNPNGPYISYIPSHDEIVSYFNSSKFSGATFVLAAKPLIPKSDV